MVLDFRERVGVPLLAFNSRRIQYNANKPGKSKYREDILLYLCNTDRISRLCYVCMRFGGPYSEDFVDPAAPKILFS